MMGILDGSYPDEVFLLKADGRKFGPYGTTFDNKLIRITEDGLDAEEGDTILHTAPNGRTSHFTVTEVSHSQGVMGAIPAHWKLSLSKNTAIREPSVSSTTNHISISGSQGIQIGDHNSQHFQMMFSELLNKIDQANGSPEEKEEAKSLVTKLLEHPLVSSVVGATLPTALGLIS